MLHVGGVNLTSQELSQFITRFVVESDAIEGIDADPELVKHQTEMGHRKGHVGALLFLESLAQQKKIITKRAICLVQGLITAEQHEKSGGYRLDPEQIGRYRSVGVSIGGRIAPLPKEVPKLMRLWITRVAVWQKKCYLNNPAANLGEIANFHYEYEHIHPFADGNGRSGRALVYYLMRYCGINPFSFTASDRYETYYRCFQDPSDMLGYFKARVTK